MADKPTDDPRNSWLSKTFGKNAPNDAPGKAAWTSFRNDFIDVEKKDIHAHGFFAIMPTILLLPLALFSYSHIDQERLQTTYDPLIQETQIEENDALDNNQFQTFIFNDTYYLLSHIDGQYRLFSYKNSAFKFIKDPRDAFLIVRNAGENMTQYAQAVTDPSIELPDTNAELFHLNQGLSQLYNANSPTRHLTGSASTEDQPITTQSYKDAGDALIATSIHIMGGQYGFSEDQDFVERGSETHIVQYEDETAKTITNMSGGLWAAFMGLTLGISGLKAGATAASTANRRRRKKKPQPPKH